MLSRFGLESRPFFTSILLGLLGFAAAFFPYLAHIPPHKLIVNWGLIFPLLAALAYGWRYGLVAALAGGALFPPFIHPEDGWAGLINVLQYTNWFFLQGYFAERARRQSRPWNSVYFAQICFFAIYLLIAFFPFRWAFALNPPFWFPNADSRMPLAPLTGIVTKAFIVQTLLLLVADSLLLISGLRQALGLKVQPAARFNGRIILSSLLIGCAITALFLLLEKILTLGLFAHIDLTRFAPEQVRVTTLVIVLSLVAGNNLARFITRRIAAEESLRQSQARYSSLVESALDGITVVQDGYIRSANAAAALAIGVPVEKIIGAHISSFLHPEEFEGVLSRHLQRLSGDDQFDDVNQYRVRRADGSFIWVEQSVALIEWDGRPAVLTFFRDVSERIAAEEELRAAYASLSETNAHLEEEIAEKERIDAELSETSQLLELAVAGAGLGTWAMDPQARTLQMSDELYEILGIPKSAALSFEQALAVIHPDDHTKILKALERVMSGESSIYDVEERVSIGNGQWKWVRNWGRPVDRSKVGLPPTLAGVAWDITDQKQAEESLRESNERYRTIFENSGDAILLLRDGVFVDCNSLAEKTYGASREQIVGHTPLDFSPAVQADGRRSAEAAQEYIARALAGAVMRFEWKHSRPDGSELDTEITLNCIDVQGQAHLQAIVRDITDIKKAEAKEARLETQLRQGQKMEAIGVLAGGIAHDFNNILFAIMGNADVALGELPAGHPAREMLLEIQTAGRRARSLVRQILTFSRKTEVEHVPLRLERIAREAVRLLRPTMPSTIELRLRLDPCQSTVRADPTEMHQVIMNLCTNAMQALADYSGVIEVALRELVVERAQAEEQYGLREGLYQILSITDTGNGIPPEIQDRIFEPFFTTKEHGKGTGMGLSVVHGIVARMGGSITLRSQPGLGTTFQIFLPAHLDAPLDSEQAAPELPGGIEHILLVDDEPDLTRVIRRMLERFGYRVTDCSSSLEALDLLRRDAKAYDLLLTDQTMPQMHGMDLAREALAVRADIPVVLMSGYSPLLSEETLSQSGVREFINKPVSISELAIVVREVLDGRKH